MATIKSYTDLEQSKKLAEILPRESADMWYNISIIDKFGNDGYDEYPSFERNTGMDIPCWSLAALLGVLSYPDLSQFSEGAWFSQAWYENLPFYVSGLENPVDACYELILKLNEQNLI